jgi:hypothetical protein
MHSMYSRSAGRQDDGADGPAPCSDSQRSQTMGPYHVICIKWGTYYSAKDVNNLFSMIQRNTSRPIVFHCFSNETEGLQAEVRRHALPPMQVPESLNKYAYKKEAGLCDDALGGLAGERVFFFDLDSLIVGNLDEFFAYPQAERFYIIKDWNTRGQHVGQASCYSWVVGTLGFVKSYFEQNPAQVLAQYGTASQEYLSAQVIKHFGALNFWPDNWFKSFKLHCLPLGILRPFLAARLPRVVGLKMIAFHGYPGLSEAVAGTWTNDRTSKKRAHGWKRMYKTIRPCPWILDYWK